MRFIAVLLYVAAAAARAVAVNRTIDILDLAIGIGPGDELKYIYVNGIIHEKELQFFCLETVELTVAPFRTQCPTRYISRNMDIVRDVGDVTYAVTGPLPKMNENAELDRSLTLEVTYISRSAHEFWTAYVEIEADAFFYDSIDDQLSLLIFKPDPFEYIKVLPEQ